MIERKSLQIIISIVSISLIYKITGVPVKYELSLFLDTAMLYCACIQKSYILYAIISTLA